MLEERRVNIAPLAKTFRAKGHITPTPDPLNGNVSDSKGKEEVWYAVKQEYMALSSLFTDMVVERAYESRVNRKPFGLIRKINAEDTPSLETETAETAIVTEVGDFLNVMLAMRDTLDLSLREEMGKFSSPQLPLDEESLRMKPAYARLKKILEKTSTSSYPHRTVEDSLQGGIGTATETMKSCLEVIPKISDSKNPEELLAIAKESFPFIAGLAMGHADIIVSLIHALKVKESKNYFLGHFSPFESEFFTIKGGRLSFSEKGEEVLQKAERSVIERANKSGTTSLIVAGCPAMVNFDGTSAVRKLWNWHLEIAEHVYPKLVQST